MHEITFLTEEQIFGHIFGHNSLEIFKKYGTEASLTDFSIILGAYVYDENTFDGNILKDRTGWYWTKSSNGDGEVRVVPNSGRRLYDLCQERTVAVRPALTFSSNPSISTNLVRGNSGLEEMKYGEYPQTIVNSDISRALEQSFNTGFLNETGKEYTVDSRRYDEYGEDISLIKLKEYEYLEKKYVRIKVNSHSSVTLSNGNTYKNDEYVWVEVEPIVWFKEPGKDLYVSKKCLYAGVRFDKANGKYYESKFDKTEANNFLQNYFSKEIIPSKTKKDKKTINEFIYIDDETRKKTHKRIIVKVKR